MDPTIRLRPLLPLVERQQALIEHLRSRHAKLTTSGTLVGDLLTDSNAYYLLHAEVSEIRATMCVQTDDAEKLQSLIADKGIDLTPPSE